MDINNLLRFHIAQQGDYELALSEIRAGEKRSCWMWYIFPQLRGLGRSKMSFFYGIADRAEAERYWADDTLRRHLVEITEAFLAHPKQPPSYIIGGIDSPKLLSCMTLFSEVAGEETDLFHRVIEKFYDGRKDEKTIKILYGTEETQ